MMVTMGNGSSTDLSQYFSQFGVSPSIGSESPCASDASLWRVMLGSDGKCYTVCTRDPSMSVEIDPSFCTAKGSIDPEEPKSVLPSWVLPVGAGALLLILLTR